MQRLKYSAKSHKTSHEKIYFDGLFRPFAFSVFLFIAFLFNPLLGFAESNENRCKELYQTGHSLQAAKCYMGLFKQVEQKPAWRQEKNLYKDRFLRSAAFSYHKASKTASSIEQKGYYIEKSVKLLLFSFKKGFCEGTDRCRTNKKLAESFRSQIHYTSLVVVTGNRSAQIQLQGYRFEQKQPHQFNQLLRPGHYKLTVSFPGSHTRSKSFLLTAKRKMTIDVTPRQIKILEKQTLIAKKTPTAIITGYVLGSTMFATSSGFAIYGYWKQSKLNSIISDPNRSHELTDQEFKKQFDRADTFRVLGIVGASLGVLTTVGTLMVHIITQQTPEKVEQKTIEHSMPANTFTHQILLVNER